jgi:vacuolar-type H+-ATPase subunit H
MTDASVEDARRPTQRLTPDRVRATVFSRSPIGRRGLNEDEVAHFQRRVAEEIAARDAAEASLRAKVAHYKNTLVQWQREQSEARVDDIPVTVPAAARPTVEAVNILSQAQQEADAHVAQTQEYCRRLAADAQGHAQEILSRAHAQADAAAAGAVHEYRLQAGDGYAADVEDLERRLAWARTFLASLETVETQLRTAREALAYEFDRISPVRG